jgi:hypothetical protein
VLPVPPAPVPSSPGFPLFSPPDTRATDVSSFLPAFSSKLARTSSPSFRSFADLAPLNRVSGRTSRGIAAPLLKTVIVVPLDSRTLPSSRCAPVVVPGAVEVPPWP